MTKALRALGSSFAWRVAYTIALSACAANAAINFTNVSDKGVCWGALDNLKSGWEQNSGFEDYVAEARRRGLSINDCQRVDGASPVGPVRRVTSLPPIAPVAAAQPPVRPAPQVTLGSTIPLIKESGTFKVSVVINGIIPLHFTVDSGASDVSIPADVVGTLIRTGTLTDNDFVGEQIYRLADGSRIKSKTFRIRQLKVGDRVVENVLGSVADVNGSLLLGQSFLSRFGKVSFDYGRQVLVLE